MSDRNDTEFLADSDDAEFLIDLIRRIIHYAEDNGMSPSATLQIIAKKFLDLLEVATFEPDEE